MKKFDLNIERVLENWEVHHALRELIANAFDERKLTGSKEVEITQLEEDKWSIRDYGRGIQIEHFTQNENLEKIENEGLIGKFGVGLKDALATLNRNRVIICIDSKHGRFTTESRIKEGYNLNTLHVIDSPPIDDSMVGTNITLTNCTEKDFEKAKSLFIDFSEVSKIDSTKYGDIYDVDENEISSIYINGVRVATEDNFLFSYNITSLTASLKKSLNRERTNVGRSAYTDRVKSILLQSKSNQVITSLAAELQNVDLYKMKEELRWQDVSLHVIKELNALDKFVFMSQAEFFGLSADNKDIIENSEKEIVIISEGVKSKIERDISNDEYSLNTLAGFLNDYIESFVYTFIDYSELNRKEKKVYNLAIKAFEYFSCPEYLNKLKISEVITPNQSFNTTLGVYDINKDLIIVRRSQLENAEDFLGTLIHELIHALTGTTDVTRDFEIELTKVIGNLSKSLFHRQGWF